MPSSESTYDLPSGAPSHVVKEEHNEYGVVGTGPGKSKMTREELIGLIGADAKAMNERDDIAEYIGRLNGLSADE